MKMAIGSVPLSSAPPIYNLHHQPPTATLPCKFIFLQKIGKNTKLYACTFTHYPSKTSVVQKSSVHSYSWYKLKQRCLESKFTVKCSQVEVDNSIVDEACELVNGSEITIQDQGDVIQAYLFTAVKNNNATGILLLSDIFGFQDSATTDFAYRVACNGYNVLVPDLFRGDSWSKERPRALLEEWISKKKPENVTRAIRASAKWMMDELAAAGISNKLGIIGFCYGGGRVVDILAQDEEAYFGSGVSFYGTRIDTCVASKIKVPLLLITGDDDALCPTSVLEDITKRNEESKMVVFRGRGHGFVHRPQSAEEDADAEEAFMIMRNWLHDGLLVRK